MSDTSLADRVRALENKARELEQMAQLALRLLSLDKPVSRLLESFGATGAQDVAVHALLDDLTARLTGPEYLRPSRAGFEAELFTRFPLVRGNQQFIRLLIETLQMDRPAYQQLHAYMVEHEWHLS